LLHVFVEVQFVAVVGTVVVVVVVVFAVFQLLGDWLYVSEEECALRLLI
jgi:hypothetical protein